MAKLLTLAISEKVPNESYKIIVYDTENNSRPYNGLDLPMENIIENGEIKWDIMAVTETQLEDRGWGLAAPVGNVVLTQRYNKESIHDLFERKKVSAGFFMYKKWYYAVVKPDKIMSMTRPEVNAEGKFQHRISFCSNGKEYNNWLNKDLRWLNYWRNVPIEKYDEKIEKWVDYFNNQNEVYLVLYRHRFQDGHSNYWIAGFHSFPNN